MKKSWKTISSKIVYRNPWLSIREDKVIRPDGRRGIYSVVNKRPVVVIIAQDKDGSIYFIKQFRYPMRKNLIELPAGMSETKNILINAKRELKEEIGITAKKWKILGKFYPLCGDASFPFYAILAKDLNTKKLNAYGQGDELIKKVLKLKPFKIKEWIGKQKIECGPSLAALNLFWNRN